jgi:hypothetical protein
MIKVHPNRTTGLQKKVIADGFTEEDCKTCGGKGKYNVHIPSTTQLKLKGRIATVCIEADCKCDNGKVLKPIRVVRKSNSIVAII